MSQKFYHINDDLLVKYLLGEATETEIEAVEGWINENDVHRKYYNDFKKIWDNSRSLAQKSLVDEEAAWLRFKTRREEAAQQEPVVKRLYPVSLLRIAALFILLAGTAYLAYNWLANDNIENRVVFSRQSTLNDTLSDGSIITLNKNASLQYPSKFAGNSRTVRMEGEAFFDVAPDKKKPFIIHVKDISITVVGTSFNVSSKNGVTEVIVESGVVEVKGQDKVVALRQGERLRVSDAAPTMMIEKTSDKLYSYYRSKEFVCDDTPLWKLVEVLNAAYDANIVIQNEDLRQLRLTTTFNNESLDKILTVVSETFGIKVLKVDQRIILKPNY